MWLRTSVSPADLIDVRPSTCILVVNTSETSAQRRCAFDLIGGRYSRYYPADSCGARYDLPAFGTPRMTLLQE